MGNQKGSVIIIGAGVLGCAVAKVLTDKGLKPIVLEKGKMICSGASGKVVGLVHSGYFFLQDTLKAESCIRGRNLLYEWCGKRNVPFNKPGKWFIGRKKDAEILEHIINNARNLDASNLTIGTSDKFIADIPEVKADVGVFSPDTGVIDPYLYATSLQSAATEKGAEFKTGVTVTGITSKSDGGFGGYKLETSAGPMEAEVIVNCAGIFADEMAKMVGIDHYKIYPCRGSYFRYASFRPMKRIIHSVTSKGERGAEVHLVTDPDGTIRLGPDTEYIDEKDPKGPPKHILESRKAVFDATVVYLEDLRQEQILFDRFAIRPRLRKPGQVEDEDFVISEDKPGFISLIGIESPGLTASLDLAERVGKLASGG